MKYRHEIAEAAVEALTAEATDYKIAETLADALLAGQRPPHNLVLNHNARVAPCPMPIDKPGAKVSSVLIHSTDGARLWIIDALSRGYGVCVGTRRDLELRTIADVRRSIQHRLSMAAWREKRAAEGPDDDGEIPF